MHGGHPKLNRMMRILEDAGSDPASSDLQCAAPLLIAYIGSDRHGYLEAYEGSFPSGARFRVVFDPIGLEQSSNAMVVLPPSKSEPMHERLYEWHPDQWVPIEIRTFRLDTSRAATGWLLEADRTAIRPIGKDLHR